MTTARTKLEVIYRDVLGEVTTLIERLEALDAKITERERADSRLAETIRQASTAASAVVRSELDRACRESITTIQSAAEGAQEAAESIETNTKKMGNLVAWVSAANLLIGMVIGLAAAKLF